MNHLTELINKLTQIEELGFVKSLRKGNTGVGYTLETLLGVEENNDSGADFGNIELKAKRDRTSGSRLSSFTQAPIWLTNSRKVVKTHGEWKEEKQRINFYTTVKFGTKNPQGLSLKIEDATLYLHSAKTGSMLARWPLAVLAFRQEQKLSNMVIVSAKTKGSGDSEEFHYHSADFYSDPSPEMLKSLIEDGTIVVDTRMWLDPSTNKLRDRGTAFRIDKSKVPLMYEKYRRIL